MLRIAYFLVGFLAVAACYMGTPQNTRNDLFTLTVENQNWQDAKVYAVWNDIQSVSRVATVVSFTTETRRLRVLAPSVEFIIQFIGGGPTFQTEPVSVQPGQEIELTIGNTEGTTWSTPRQ